MFRRHLFSAAVLAASLTVTLAGCGSSGSATSATTAATSAASATAKAGAASSTTAAAAGGSSGGCAALTREDLVTFLTDTQLLAQVTSPDQVATLKAGKFGNYTPDSFGRILTNFHGALDGHPAPGFGEPKDAIAFYEKLNASMRAMFAAPTVTDQMISDYQALSGGVQNVIAKQLPINAALPTTCKNLA